MGQPAKSSGARRATPADAAADGAFSVLNSAVDNVSRLPPRERAPTLWLIVIVAFAIAALTTAGWIATHSGVSGAACSQTSGGNISGGNVSCAEPPRSEKAK